MFQRLHITAAAAFLAVMLTTSVAGAVPRAPAMATDLASPASQLAATPPASCRDNVRAFGASSGYAPKFLKRQLARARALSDWRNKVRDLHGTGFTTWASARQREIACDTALGKQHCVAQAQPCQTALGSVF